MADGWAVEVVTKVLGRGEAKQIWYAHIPDRFVAEESVARRIPATPDVRVEAKEPIPHDTLVADGIAEGEVSQWI